MPRLMAFVDGENLTVRFEDMVKAGRKPRTVKDYQIRPVEHQQGRFVWSPSTVSGFPDNEEIIRVHYYTTFTGGNDELESFREHIATHCTWITVAWSSVERLRSFREYFTKRRVTRKQNRLISTYALRRLNMSGRMLLTLFFSLLAMLITCHWSKP